MNTKPHAVPGTTAAEGELARAITAHYLETGKDCTVAEIAARLEWSESKVRKVLAGCGGAPAGCHTYKDSAPSYSTAYRNFQSGAHVVWKYGPSRETLRTLVLGGAK